MKFDATAGAARRLKNRRETLNKALKHIQTIQREAQHRRGYAAHPVEANEFGEWKAEQVWPD